jgi:hypothetical protein
VPLTSLVVCAVPVRMAQQKRVSAARDTHPAALKTDFLTRFRLPIANCCIGPTSFNPAILFDLGKRKLQ